MPAYRFTDPAPVLFNLLGTASAPLGRYYFYEKGTNDEKDTWSDEAMTVPDLNPNPVPLDASGRPTVQIWLDGEYTVRAEAADGTEIWTRDIVPAIVPGLAIPAISGGVLGYFLSNNGTDPIWVPLIQLPDPTGSAGYMVVANSGGTGYILQPVPTFTPPTPEYDITSGFIRIGTLLIQWGTGTVPAAPSAKTNAVNITFATAFSGTPYIVDPINKTPGGSTPSGGCAVLCSSAESSTGATITANIPDDDTNNNWKLGNPTNFSYFAIGPTTA